MMEEHTIPLKQLEKPLLTVQISEDAVNRMAASDGPLPPIKLARVDGRLYPMSRSVALEASRVRGDDTLRCTITDYKTKESAVYDAILAQYRNEEKPMIDCFDIPSLKAMLRVRRESLVDSSGKPTLEGTVRGLMLELGRRRLNVLVLAYIASGPPFASREKCEDVAWEFNIRGKSIQNAFSDLAGLGLITRVGRGAYKLSDMNRYILKPYMQLLNNINFHRDTLFRKSHP